MANGAFARTTNNNGEDREDECKGEEEKSKVVFIKKHMTIAKFPKPDL